MYGGMLLAFMTIYEFHAEYYSGCLHGHNENLDMVAIWRWLFGMPILLFPRLYTSGGPLGLRSLSIRPLHLCQVSKGLLWAARSTVLHHLQLLSCLQTAYFKPCLPVSLAPGGGSYDRSL